MERSLIRRMIEVYVRVHEWMNEYGHDDEDGDDGEYVCFRVLRTSVVQRNMHEYTPYADAVFMPICMG